MKRPYIEDFNWSKYALVIFIVTTNDLFKLIQDVLIIVLDVKIFIAKQKYQFLNSLNFYDVFVQFHLYCLGSFAGKL